MLLVAAGGLYWLIFSVVLRTPVDEPAVGRGKSS
jgi:hypothetical protein